MIAAGRDGVPVSQLDRRDLHIDRVGQRIADTVQDILFAGQRVGDLVDNAAVTIVGVHAKAGIQLIVGV